MSTTQPDPANHQDGNLDTEKDMFCCGEPIWPRSKFPYRAEFSMSCGWVIVDREGRESTLGYASEKQARDVAEKMTYAYWLGMSDGSMGIVSHRKNMGEANA